MLHDTGDLQAKDSIKIQPEAEGATFLGVSPERLYRREGRRHEEALRLQPHFADAHVHPDGEDQDRAVPAASANYLCMRFHAS